MSQSYRSIKLQPLIEPLLATADAVAGLQPFLRVILRDWPLDITAGNGIPDLRRPSGIRLKTVEKGFIRRSNWLKRPAIYHHPVDACCDLVVDLVNAYAQQNPDLLCLHCAAVLGQQGLILFPATHQAGKSLLSAQLAASGYRLFSDDILPVGKSDHRGIALGIQPRLRTPLPDKVNTDLLEFISAHLGPASDRFLYLDLKHDHLAKLGERAPVRHLVLLKQDSCNSKTTLQPIEKEQMLMTMIQQRLPHSGTASDALDCLFTMVQNSDCHELHYEDPRSAVNMLQQLHAPPSTGEQPGLQEMVQ